MSTLLAKVRRAKQAIEPEAEPTPVNPLDAIGKPPPIPAKRPVPTKSNKGKTRARGRPRSSLARRELELRPIEAWVHKCLRPEAGAMEYIGSTNTRIETTTSGKVIRIKVEYDRETLADNYLGFCRANGYQPMVPRTFSALILEACLAFGWPCRLGRTHDLRRGTIYGLCLQHLTPFDGDERHMVGYPDRKRWLKKSDR